MEQNVNRGPDLRQATSVSVIRNLITTQAVGLGEEHDRPESRREAESMIRDGLVVRLLIEMPMQWQSSVDQISQNHTNKSQSELEALIKATYGYISPFKPYPNDYPFERLIAVAIMHNVQVVCAEHNGYFFGNLANTTISKRNDNIKSVFKSVVKVATPDQPAAQGTLFLFGSFHFSGKLNSSLASTDFNVTWADPCASAKEQIPK